MKTKSLCIAIAALLFCSQSSFGQGGPYLSDEINPKAWWNPMFEFNPQWLDPYYSTTVLQGQTLYVASRGELQEKQKDYYVFQSHQKDDGIAVGEWVSSKQHKAYLKWDDPNDGDDGYFYYYPSQGDYDTIFDAKLNEIDQRCFQDFNGPYCTIVDNPFYVGQVSGVYWLAFSGILRPMGGEFKESQINKIKEVNKYNNNGPMKSDLRATLVSQFLALHPLNPEFADQIPVDTNSTLNDDSNSDNYAVVCHILPRIAPEGNGCGRNAFRNALLVSQNLKDQIEAAGYPGPGFIMYCEWLATLYNKTLPQPKPPQAITYREIRDLRELARMDVEYLDEDETRAFLDYVRNSTRR
jgi:hypothetical protein